MSLTTVQNLKDLIDTVVQFFKVIVIFPGFTLYNLILIVVVAGFAFVVINWFFEATVT